MKLRFFLMVILGAALSTAAMAQGNSGNHGDGHGKGNPHNAQRDDDRDDRWEARNGWEYRTYEKGHMPPGWSKGKKTGWGNCNLPPGQAKKYGCNQYRYGGRDYYWYRDEHERIIVRRPIIHAHAGVDVGH